MSKINPDINYIRKYVNGELSPREMFELERAVQEDEMLMDILLGMEQEQLHNYSSDLSDLRQRIHARSHVSNNKRLFLWKSLSLAASLLLVLGLGGYLIWNNGFSTKETRIAQSPEELNLPTASISKSADTAAAAEKTEQQQVLNQNAIAHSADSKNTNLDHREQQPNKVASRAYTPTKKEGIPNVPFPRQTALRDSPVYSVAALKSSKAGNLIVIQNSPSKEEIIIGEGLLDSNKEHVIATNIPQPIQGRADGIRVADVGKSSSSNRAALSRLNLDAQSNYILGQVLDKQSGNPIGNVQIKDIENNNIISTDSAGNFVYLASRKNAPLEINAMGYEKEKVLTDNSSQTIFLNRDDAKVEEVVITAARKTPLKSEPASGWKEFKTYISTETKKVNLGKGIVALTFSINADGRPENILVSKSANLDLDRKAIEIVKQGPSWIVGTNGKPVYLTVEFK